MTEIVIGVGAKLASAALPLLVQKIKKIAEKKKKQIKFQEASGKTAVLNLSGHPLAIQTVEKVKEMVPDSVLIDVPIPNTTPNSLEEDAAKIIEEAANNGIAMHLLTGQFIVAPCGMTALWSVILTMLHGISGHFPRILVLWRENNVYTPNRIIHLQEIREIHRETRF